MLSRGNAVSSTGSDVGAIEEGISSRLGARARTFEPYLEYALRVRIHTAADGIVASPDRAWILFEGYEGRG